MLKIDINLVFTIINILILTVAMRLLLFKPVKDIIARRREEADQEYEKAQADRRQAEELKQQYNESLQKLEEERKETMFTVRKNADAEYQRIVGSAEEKAAAIKSDAQIQAESTRQQVLKRAEREIADMVLEATAKISGDVADGKQINGALYDEFLNKAGERP